MSIHLGNLKQDNKSCCDSQSELAPIKIGVKWTGLSGMNVKKRKKS